MNQKIFYTEDRRNDKPRLSGLKFIQNHCAKVLPTEFHYDNSNDRGPSWKQGRREHKSKAINISHNKRDVEQYLKVITTPYKIELS